jgi:hypothetical protein
MRKSDQFRRVLAHLGIIASGPPNIDLNVASASPTQLLQTLQKRRYAGLPLWAVSERRHQDADARLPVSLLCIRRDRPCCRATNNCDEIAPSHSDP